VKKNKEGFTKTPKKDRQAIDPGNSVFFAGETTLKTRFDKSLDQRRSRAPLPQVVNVHWHKSCVAA
jgi:hypothetical protein